MLPGATYVDPEFSWKYEIGPAGTTFVTGNALGPEYNGTLWIGSARSFQQVGGNGGSLYRLQAHAPTACTSTSAPIRGWPTTSPTTCSGRRSSTAPRARRCRSARGFGTTPDIEQGPDGNLYVVSVTDNAIYKISRRP